jgi:hypothetical protein
MESLFDHLLDGFQVIFPRRAHVSGGLANEFFTRVTVHLDSAVIDIQEPSLLVLDVDGGLDQS